MQLSIIVPTFNESANIAELVTRIARAVRDRALEIVFVDDSSDDTPRVIEEVAATAPVPVRLIHRARPVDGLGGAVLEGLHAAAADRCLVMDADLQHPPEDIPVLLRRFDAGDADVVVASRYLSEGSAHGLAGRVRVAVSRASTLLAKAMFPVRLRECTDPMTGFFLADRRSLRLADLRPRGFKILLELLVRTPLRVAEVPFHFADRFAGTSKASFRQGVHFVQQLAGLRFGKMSVFALIGVLGAVANVGIVWLLTRWGLPLLPAAIIAAEATIIGNFLLQERFVFADVRESASGPWMRFAKSMAFNNVEAAVRIPIMAVLVEAWHISSALATAVTLAVAFIARFLFHSLVVYAPKKSRASRSRELLSELDEQAMSPGEL